MPWSSGVFSKIHTWLNDQSAIIPILSSRFDEQELDIANGINSCRFLGGGTNNVPSADLQMAGFRHKNVGNPVLRTDYLSTAFAQDNSHLYAETAGSSNAYTLTLSPPIPAYVNGMVVCARWHSTSEETSVNALTLNVNGLGDALIKYCNADGLSDVTEEGALLVNTVNLLVYVNSYWILVGYTPVVFKGCISSGDYAAGTLSITGTSYTVLPIDGSSKQNIDYVNVDLLNERVYPIRPGVYNVILKLACWPQTVNNLSGYIEPYVIYSGTPSTSIHRSDFRFFESLSGSGLGIGPYANSEFLINVTQSDIDSLSFFSPSGRWVETASNPVYARSIEFSVEWIGY